LNTGVSLFSMEMGQHGKVLRELRNKEGFEEEWTLCCERKVKMMF